MMLLLVAVLVVALGLVVLFAMVGQLTARVQALTDLMAPDSRPRPITLGPVTGSMAWPAEVADVAAHGAIVSLSTICASCRKLAESISTAELPRVVGIVVSGPSADECASFVNHYSLGTWARVASDEMGRFTSTTLGLAQSPALVEVVDGRPTGRAFGFNSWPSADWFEQTLGLADVMQPAQEN